MNGNAGPMGARMNYMPPMRGEMMAGRGRMAAGGASAGRPNMAAGPVGGGGAPSMAMGGPVGKGGVAATLQMLQQKKAQQAAGAAQLRNVGYQVGQFQNMAREGVQGYGDMLGDDFRKQVGNYLGDLNSIGGLRSGAVASGLADFGNQYGRAVGQYASMATRDAMGMGQEQASLEAERQYRDMADKRARKGGLLRGVGKILGGVAGSVLGPAGGVIGTKLGEKVGGWF